MYHSQVALSCVLKYVHEWYTRRQGWVLKMHHGVVFFFLFRVSQCGVYFLLVNREVELLKIVALFIGAHYKSDSH